MTAETKAAGMGATTQDPSRDKCAEAKQYCDNNERLQDAITQLRLGIEATSEPSVRVVLEDCIKLMTDVCLMNHGFGAALRAKYKSR